MLTLKRQRLVLSPPSPCLPSPKHLPGGNPNICLGGGREEEPGATQRGLEDSTPEAPRFHLFLLPPEKATSAEGSLFMGGTRWGELHGGDRQPPPSSGWEHTEPTCLWLALCQEEEDPNGESAGTFLFFL